MTPAALANSTVLAQGLPLRLGVVLFQGFQALDVFGPLDVLGLLSVSLGLPVQLFLLASTLAPVSNRSPQGFEANGSTFWESVVPTHTFKDAPPIDMLLVPGGIGMHPVDSVNPAVDYIRDVFPSLQYLFAVCTGAIVAARAGVLDGRRATTNKRVFKQMTPLHPNVDWVSHARWVEDGNVWTSSGVTAGIDATFGFVKMLYGEEVAKDVANLIEYERHTDASWDPFADIYDLD